MKEKLIKKTYEVALGLANEEYINLKNIAKNNPDNKFLQTLIEVTDKTKGVHNVA